MSADDYRTYRGKCKEMSEALVAADSTLRLVAGHYHCPLWGKQEHWWCVKPDGSVADPTAKQFPSVGTGDYVPWDGQLECEQCGEKTTHEDATIDGHHVFCSYRCYGICVGMI